MLNNFLNDKSRLRTKEERLRRIIKIKRFDERKSTEFCSCNFSVRNVIMGKKKKYQEKYRKLNEMHLEIGDHAVQVELSTIGTGRLFKKGVLSQRRNVSC